MHKDESPRAWLMQGPRHGDNEQVLALGAAIHDRFGWECAVKRMVYRTAPPARVPLAQSLDHVDLAKSDAIAGPEAGPAPDLVIAVGRRAAPVARWIKSQPPSSRRHAGTHVQIGRYQDRFEDVDLLVTTSQYALPAAPNVIHLTLPITARPAAQFQEAAAAFADSWPDLPRPFIGVLVGGPSHPVRFGQEEGRRLVAGAMDFAAQCGGTLLVATSPRTPAAVTEHLRQQLTAPHRLFVFAETRNGPNPYLALLASADRFVVTTDSVSMVADACLTGRETRLFFLPVEKRRSLWRPSRPNIWAGRRRIYRLADGAPADVIDRWFDGLVRAGLAQPARYVPILTRRLLADRHVSRLGDPLPPLPGIAGLAQEELGLVVGRIAALLSARRAAPGG